MKIKRKILSMLLIGMVFCSYPVCASTTTISSDEVVQENKSNIVENWNYKIYDANGNEKSEGIFKSISGLRANLVNNPITLGNGETVVLMPDNNGDKGIYCESGTKMNIIYKLNREANLKVTVRGYSDHSGKFNKNINAKNYSTTYRAPHTDNYFAILKNCSSDPVTVQSFYLIF